MLAVRDIEIFLYGAAAILDTAVLLVLVERRNWPRVMMPLLLLIVAVWLFQGAAFLHLLLLETPGAAAFQWAAKELMVAGLVLQPSAALHAAWRLRRTGFATGTPHDPRAVLFYAPMIAVVAIGGVLWGHPNTRFLDAVGPLVPAYVVWLAAANVLAGVGCLTLLRRFTTKGERSFLGILGGTLVGLAAAEAVLLLVGARLWPDGREAWVAAATLAPGALALLVAYVIVRFHFMQLVLQRSVIYAAAALGAVLLHRVLLVDIWTDLGERYHFDFVLLEGAIIAALIFVYEPFRRRAAEALRYLMGESMAETRLRARSLAVDMAARFGEPVDDLLVWFRAALAKMLGVDFVAVWLLEPGERVTTTSGDVDSSEVEVLGVFEALRSRDMSSCQRNDAPTRRVADALTRADGSVFVRLEHPRVAGLLMCGQRVRWRDFSGEQLAALTMLVEQLGITISNGLLLAERSTAERRALQNEKLSTLGLVAGSIAHEVKNPLSSIKTLTTVLIEDLDESSEAGRDLQLILHEVNRLSSTVTEILQFARPATRGARESSVALAVEGTLRIMRHVARQHGVELLVEVDEDLPTVAAEDDALREVVFNLLANAVRAAGVGGSVTVGAALQDGRVRMEVVDTGPGVPADLRERIFEPFVSGEKDGTGLGLYVVSRRLRDMGGDIELKSGESGTTFVVGLPIAKP